MKHAVRCETITDSNKATSNTFYTCLVDILRYLRDYDHEINIDQYLQDYKGELDRVQNLQSKGIHYKGRAFDIGTFRTNIYLHVEYFTIQKLLQIGKQGNTPSNDLQFRKACHRDSIHPAVRERADRLARDKVECHLSHKCKIHSEYDI